MKYLFPVRETSLGRSELPTDALSVADGSVASSAIDLVGLKEQTDMFDAITLSEMVRGLHTELAGKFVELERDPEGCSSVRSTCLRRSAN